MIKTIENILKQGEIEEYQAEAKMIVFELSGLSEKYCRYHKKGKWKIDCD